MSTLLIQNIRSLVSCDDADTVYENVDLYAEDGFIRAIGKNLPQEAEKVIDASHMLCYPGLVNTHHHLYQVFSRNLPEVQNMELFDWLKTLYEIWKNLDEDVIRLSTLTGLGELMKHGCTTCFDHHYVFPAGAGDLIGAQFAASDEIGARMYASRGSMDLSVKDGGLPPDSVVQTVDEIMADSARVIEKYHDKSFGAMHRVALAPCSPFSVSADLLRESAVLAREYGVRLHTHLCETKDEEHFMLAREGVRPLEYMERLGWTGSDVWFAHGIRKDTGKILDLVKEYDCDTIVIGLNKNLDGSDSIQTEKVYEFRTMLENKMRSGGMKGIEVVWQDERFTTVIAERVLIEADVRRKDRKKVIDKQAAVVILQSYLDSLR